MAKIDVMSSCLVGMANGKTLANFRMELTPWDLRLLLLDHIQRGLLFHKPEFEYLKQTNIIHHLKNSLSRTLDFFPPLAGRLETFKNDSNTTVFFLDCNNAGVEFTHAIARGVSVSDILEPIYVPEIVSSFFQHEGLPNCEGVSKPLLWVQVTELVDGYFIGCTANHCVVDGTSFWHFFNSWSEISRGSDDSISKNPVFERWFPGNINPLEPIPIPPLKQNLQNNFSSTPILLRRVFHFSKENVAKLKGKANLEAGTDKISSLQAVSAHLWRSVVRKRQSIHGNNNKKEVSCMLVVGARPRIPLPDGYFGNAVYPARFATSEVELLQNGLGWAALKLNELVAQQTSEATVQFVEEWVKNPMIVMKGINNFAINSSPWHNVYGNDFGWGKPVAVRSGLAQNFDGMMTVFPAPESSGGGIHVEACLAPQTLRAVGEDPEFMGAVAII